MPKKKITIDLNGDEEMKKELDTDNTLKQIRTFLLDSINYPFSFIFIDDDDEEKVFPKKDEVITKLSDILDGRNLHIKKEKIIRTKVGKKLFEKGDIEFYLYPKAEFTTNQLDCSSNIMVVGETGVGKSTWIHSFLNYMQGIQIEENIIQ